MTTMVGKPNAYDSSNPEHQAIAQQIAEKRGSLTAHEKATLKDALDAGDRDTAQQILGK
jgi:hypothetical protein